MSKKPTLIAYTVRQRGKTQSPTWTRVGAAWPHGSGTGFSIELEAYPVNGRLVLLEPKADEAPAEETTAGEQPAEDETV